MKEGEGCCVRVYAEFSRLLPRTMAYRFYEPRLQYNIVSRVLIYSTAR